MILDIWADMNLLKDKIKYQIRFAILILIFQLILHGCKCSGNGSSGNGNNNTGNNDQEEPKPQAFFLATDKIYQAGEQPISIVAVDLNNDSNQDVISANKVSGDISVLMGNGDGTLQAAQHYYIAISPEDVNSTDLNNDDNQDVIVTHSTETGGISILLGNGDGSLQIPVTYPAAGEPRKIAVADFNFDGNQDFATGSFSGNVKVFMGNGDGTVYNADEVLAGFTPISVASGDMNGDGFIDLIAGNFISGDETVWISLNILATDSFLSLPSLAFDGGSGIYDIKVSDINSDGRLDVIAARERVTILLGLGDGELGDPNSFSTDYSGNLASNIEVTDMTGDGNTDIITNSSTMTILPGHGDGTFSAPIWIDTGIDESPSDITISDMNNDGKLDVVSCYNKLNSIKVFLTP